MGIQLTLISQQSDNNFNYTQNATMYSRIHSAVWDDASRNSRRKRTALTSNYRVLRRSNIRFFFVEFSSTGTCRNHPQCFTRTNSSTPGTLTNRPDLRPVSHIALDFYNTVETLRHTRQINLVKGCKILRIQTVQQTTISETYSQLEHIKSLYQLLSLPRVRILQIRLCRLVTRFEIDTRSYPT